ncbi:MAG: four helix bundle protein [Candidatus Ratteibacteria bacterium]|nr:four helix bundle protein [Candidatus Ratteibacteria bacterium]
MGKKIKNFRDLNIWQKGIEIVEDIYKITKTFPKDEHYGLTAQMRRCSISIPLNVAEGFARRHNKEYKQFLNITLGSCAELETQIEISLRLEYLTESTYDKLLEKLNHITRMIINLSKLL